MLTSRRALFRSREVATLALAALLATSCIHASKNSIAQHEDRTVLTHEQMAQQSFPSVYAAIEALRGTWLTERGTDSFYAPTAIVVYMNNNKLGGVDNLRAIPVTSVISVQHFDGLEATARWGVGHSKGVIQVRTQ